MISRPRLLRSAAAVVVCGAAVLGAAAPASADSLAYVKDGNVWLATPDGARQQQVTRTGGYHYVSQADDGTMIALTGKERLHKLSRTGQVLADFATYVSDGAPTSGPVNEFHGPFDPEISPDGTKVAFEWFNENYSSTDGCNAQTVPPCHVLASRQGVGITHSDRFTGFEEFGLKTGWIWPSWVSDERIVRSDANTVLTEDAVFDDIGPGKADAPLDRWLLADWSGGLSDVELSRDAKTMVAIAGLKDDQLHVYRTVVSPFGAPDPNLSPWGPKNPPLVEGCEAFGHPEGGKFFGVSLAPDGRHMAYGVGNGVWAVDLPDLANGCAKATRNQLVLPGVKRADWGPADIPPASAYAVAETPAAPAGTTTATASPQAQPGKQEPRRQQRRSSDEAIEVLVARRRLGAALRKGLSVSVRTGAAGRLSATGLVGRAQVAQGSATVGAKGSATLKLRFTKAGKRKLRRSRSATLRVQVASRPAAGGDAIRTATTVPIRR